MPQLSYATNSYDFGAAVSVLVRSNGPYDCVVGCTNCQAGGITIRRPAPGQCSTFFIGPISAGVGTVKLFVASGDPTTVEVDVVQPS